MSNGDPRGSAHRAALATQFGEGIVGIPARRLVEDGAALLVRGVHVRAAVDQQVDDSLAAVRGAQMPVQGCAADRIDPVDHGARLEQQLDEVLVAALGSEVEGGRSVGLFIWITP